ncbi:hypothetical protein [Saccharothrix texasensis]|uniref:Hemolysin type calcium-binding protein n=1 Tax=Saccharothrix texasensis TaxID=103734 RepID=A0A3N1GXI6_9PSEU|nr:hypothetical protein [Saccharothrix texasensis]ROP34980.1 hemolysin type calcium-binding protein [Saccharothrix texasensis]
MALVAVTVATGAITGASAEGDAYGGWVRREGNTIHFVAYEGFQNHVDAQKEGEMVIVDQKNPIALRAGSGCWQSGFAENAVTCGEGVTAVHIDLGDEDDELSVREPMSTVLGGPGSDVIKIGMSDDTVSGGAGDDTILTWQEGSGSDTLKGGDGTDTVEYGYGSGSPPGDFVYNDIESITGNPGPYTLLWIVEGAAHVDVHDAELRHTAAPDRANSAVVSPLPGGRHLVRDAAPIVAGVGCRHLEPSDLTAVACDGVRRITLVGDDGDDRLANGTDLPATLLGGSGDDVLEGGSGEDVLDGGTGTDTCAGGERVRSCER